MLLEDDFTTPVVEQALSPISTNTLCCRAPTPTLSCPVLSCPAPTPTVKCPYMYPYPDPITCSYHFIALLPSVLLLHHSLPYTYPTCVMVQDPRVFTSPDVPSNIQRTKTSKEAPTPSAVRASPRSCGFCECDFSACGTK